MRSALDEAPDDERAIAAIRSAFGAGAAVTLRLWGQSMFPAILAGTRVRFAPADFASVEVGDVVLAALGPGVVAHRVVARDAESLRMRGDASLADDAPLPAEAVLGIAEGVLVGVQVPAPRMLARPVNRIVGGAAHAFTALRPLSSPLLGATWGALRRVPPVLRARKALQPFDVHPIDDAWARRARELVLASGNRPTRGALERWAAAAQTGSGHHGWVAADGRRPIGWLLAYPEHGRTIFELWVDRFRRGIGVGSALLDTASETAAEEGWADISLTVPRRAARWFTPRGFVPTSTGGSRVTLRRFVQPGASHVRCG